MSAEILANVIRGETIESIHRGHFIVVDGEGNTIASAGDPDTVTFYRSSCKVLQAIPLITSGAADAFGFDEEEIALVCASHSGQKRHVEVAASMLAKIGLDETALHCGTHLPFYRPAANELIREGKSPSTLQNNCSGKHAGMLAVARKIGADIETYEHLENPVQQQILEIISKFTEIPKDEIAVASDGCCVPNFAVPVRAMARSLASLISRADSFGQDISDAAKRLVRASLNHPELIGGTDRLDTQIMQAAPGKILSKVGADGVWLGGVLPCDQWKSGLGIAVKIEDGDDNRGRPVVVVEILRHLGVLATDDLPTMSPMPVKNRRGQIVGSIKALCEKLLNNR
ncbi:MAG: asparaginase [Acidobacteriota bacterium]